MNILEILSPQAIKVPLLAAGKKAAIDELVDLLAVNQLVADPAALKRAVWEREQQRSTGIGEGLAIPHGKCDTLARLVMAIGKPAQPMEFESFDKRPVRLIVLLASPPDKTSEHIQALGKISRLMANVAFRNKAYEAMSAEALYQLFRQTEAAPV